MSAPHDPVPARQRAIYLAGARGGRPLLPMPFAALEKAAQRALPAKNWGYLAGGAGQEHTMAANLGAFQHWEIVPRMLRDVRQRQLEVEVFGQRYPSPYFLSPIGVLELAHREADLAVVRAASKLQIPMVFSNQASVSMERCAAAMGPSPRWFQLYWSKSDELVRSFLQRAENCGCQALVVTLDTPLLGWRPRDLTQGYLPFLRGQGLAQYLEDPVFLAYLSDPARAPQAQSGKVNLQAIQLLVEVCRSHPGSFWQNLRSGRALRAVRQFVDIYSRADLTWERLAWLRQQTRLPIILKGILSGSDAQLALENGVDGIWVSNHGGRQVDGSRASLNALVEVVEQVQQRAPVLFDSGIRSGADAAKALALGADMVGIGRPYAYALALAGQAGVEELLQDFLAEFDLTLALSGATSASQLELLRR